MKATPAERETREARARRDALVADTVIRHERAGLLRAVGAVLGEWAVGLVRAEIEHGVPGGEAQP